MEIQVRFKNKISEPLMRATDFCIESKETPEKTMYSLVFKVCHSEGVFKTYSFDSCDENLLKALLEKITAKGQFLYDTACKVCKQSNQGTALNYDMYLDMTKSGELDGELKFAGGDYVITV